MEHFDKIDKLIEGFDRWKAKQPLSNEEIVTLIDLVTEEIIDELDGDNRLTYMDQLNNIRCKLHYLRTDATKTQPYPEPWT